MHEPQTLNQTIPETPEEAARRQTAERNKALLESVGLGDGTGLNAKSPMSHYDDILDLISQPSPIEWIVEDWIQEQALCMVFGPPGSGKTFLVLHWCLSMASGVTSWNGKEIIPGNVIYMAGEGHRGLQGRAAAWIEHHQTAPKRGSFLLSKKGAHLNTPDGYELAVKELRTLPKPNLIIVDTLHKHFNGEENSAKDAGSMIEACSRMMAELGCSVLLVHHTGVSEAAKGRARGSSAWRGALDIEISVELTGLDDVRKACQTKSKETAPAAPFCFELESVFIPGWIDRKGRQVSSCVIVESEETPETAKRSGLSSNQKLLIAAYQSAASSCAIIENGKTVGISESDLRKAFKQKKTLEKSLSPNSLNKAFRDCVDAFLKMGLFVEPRDGIYLFLDDKTEQRSDHYVRESHKAPDKRGLV